MLNGLYRSASAMDTAAHRHEMISHNLANLNVAGFKRTMMAVMTNEIATQRSAADRVQGNRIGAVVHDFSHGTFQSTERPLDFAINGPGFFEIRGENETLYTRNGSFQVNQQGALVNGMGLPVLSNGAEIQIPPNINTDAIQVSADGTISASGQPLGKLEVVDFPDPSGLTSFGSSLFRANQTKPEPATSGIVQGSLESSNVSAVSEMIEMMVGMRHFELARKTLQTISAAIENYTNMDRQ